MQSLSFVCLFLNKALCQKLHPDVRGKLHLTSKVLQQRFVQIAHALAFFTLWEYCLLKVVLLPTRYMTSFISILVRAQVSRSYGHLKNQFNNLSTSLKTHTNWLHWIYYQKRALEISHCLINAALHTSFPALTQFQQCMPNSHMWETVNISTWNALSSILL